MAGTEQDLIKDMVRVTSNTGISYTELRNMPLFEYRLIRAEAVKIGKEGNES